MEGEQRELLYKVHMKQFTQKHVQLMVIIVSTHKSLRQSFKDITVL